MIDTNFRFHPSFNYFPLFLKFNIQKFSLTSQSASVQNFRSFCKRDYKRLSHMLLTNKCSRYCCSKTNKFLQLWYNWLEIGLEACIPRKTIQKASMPSLLTQKTSNFLKSLHTARNECQELSSKVHLLTEKVEIEASRYCFCSVFLTHLLEFFLELK